MTESINAKLVDMEYIQIHPTTVPGKGILITEGVRGDGAILVNEQGKRFINELLTGDVVSQNILKQPNAHAYVIFNDAPVKQNKTIDTYFKQKLVFEGDSVQALATAIKMDPKPLSAALAAYTGYAKAKKDTEFGALLNNR